MASEGTAILPSGLFAKLGVGRATRPALGTGLASGGAAVHPAAPSSPNESTSALSARRPAPMRSLACDGIASIVASFPERVRIDRHGVCRLDGVRS